MAYCTLLSINFAIKQIDMDIQTRKINFVQEFLRLRNTKLIEKLERILLEDKAKDYETNLKPLSIDNFNKMIDKSIEDTKQGNVINARELKESVKKWKQPSRFFGLISLLINLKTSLIIIWLKQVLMLRKDQSRTTIILENNPKSGRKEDLLAERPQEFRFIIVKNYKIIYLVDFEFNIVNVSMVFDTRQNPVKIEKVE